MTDIRIEVWVDGEKLDLSPIFVRIISGLVPPKVRSKPKT